MATIYDRVIAVGVEEAGRRGDSQEGVGVQGDARSDGEGLQPEGAGVYTRRRALDFPTFLEYFLVCIPPCFLEVVVKLDADGHN